MKKPLLFVAGFLRPPFDASPRAFRVSPRTWFACAIRQRSRWLLSLLAFAGAAAGASSGPPASSNPKPADKTASTSHPAPGPNVRLIMTAMTEFTPAGRERRDVTPESPAYYLAHSLGPKNKGDVVSETPIAPEIVESTLGQALAKNGYLRVSANQGPDLTVVYMWGAHNNFDASVTPVSEDVLIRNILDRAALVGGRKFAAELAKAYRDTESLALSSPGVAAELPAHLQGTQLGIQRGMAVMNSTMSPLRLFAMRSGKHQQLLDQASGACYFVVASAYDPASLGRKEPQLLWRTRLTVAARGVSQTQALPALIEAGANFFGRDMEDPVILKASPVRSGRVEVGSPATVP